ncbi:hypothetical protein ACUUL3_12665 [Thiovibrio sp. JS02]
MNLFGRLRIPAIVTLAALLSWPHSGQAADLIRSSCNALGESLLNAHSVYQNNHRESLAFLQEYIQQGKEVVLARQKLIDAHQNNLAAMRAQMEALKKLTVQGGSEQEAVDRYNGMVQEFNLLNAEFGEETRQYGALLDEYNSLVGMYNTVAGSDPATQGCGDYLPRLAASPFAASHPLDRERALLLCAEENRAIAELNRIRAAIEASSCGELISSLPGFPSPRQTELIALPAPSPRKTAPPPP